MINKKKKFSNTTCHIVNNYQITIVIINGKNESNECS